MNTFHMHCFSLWKMSAQPTKTLEIRAKTVWQVNSLYFLMHISKRLTFWNFNDGIQSPNKNEPVSQCYI
jgi:hypothetical protein